MWANYNQTIIKTVKQLPIILSSKKNSLGPLGLRSLVILLICGPLLACQSTPPASQSTYTRKGSTTIHTRKTPPINMTDILPRKRKQPGIYYTVRKGDTLWKVAKRYEVKIPAIFDANPGLDVADIAVGTKLFLPNANPFVDDPKTNTQTSVDQGRSVDDGTYHWPLQGRVLRPYKHTMLGYTRYGVVLSAKANTDVRSPRQGRVILATHHFGGLGSTVIIDHGGIWSILAPLKNIHVRPNQIVNQDQVIGQLDTPGNSLQSPGLYVELRQSGSPVNPRGLMK